MVLGIKGRITVLVFLLLFKKMFHENLKVLYILLNIVYTVEFEKIFRLILSNCLFIST